MSEAPNPFAGLCCWAPARTEAEALREMIAAHTEMLRAARDPLPHHAEIARLGARLGEIDEA